MVSMEEGRDGQVKEGAEHLCERIHQLLFLSFFFFFFFYIYLQKPLRIFDRDRFQ
jgi:hypothetical protein